MAHAMPIPEITEASKRGHERLVAYWQSLIKAGKRFPTEEQVEPSTLSDLWGSMFLLNTNKTTGNYFRYEYMGAAMIEAYGVDLTGKLHDEYTEPNVKSILRAAAEIAKTGEVATDDGEFTNTQGECVKYRCSLVPLGSEQDPDQVHFILGFIRWKVA